MDVMSGLRWSEADMTMKEFVEKFRRSLPVLSIVTSGYAGCDEDMHQIGAGEMYWIYEIQTQKRIVARPKDIFDCYICIPIDYPVQVQIINNKEKPGACVSIVDLEERLVGGGSESLCFQFESDRSVPLMSGAATQKTAQLGELQAEDTYEEKYLLAYSVCGGKICSKTIAIPVYLDVSLSTCDQLTQTPRRHDYERWMEDVSDITRTFQNNQTSICKEIISFNQTPSGVDYEYVNPSLFIGVQNSSLKSSSSSSEGKQPKNAKADDGNYLNSRIQNDYDCFSKQQKRTVSSAGPPKSSSGRLLHTELSFPLPPFPGSTPSSPLESGRSDQETKAHLLKTKKRSDEAKAVHPPPKAALPRPIPPRNQRPDTSLSGEGGSNQASRRPPPPPPPPVKHQVTSPGVTLSPKEPPSNRCVTMDGIPPETDIESLTVDEVCSVLCLLNLDGHSGSFEQRQIDGALLFRITEESLREELGLSGFEAKKLTMFVHEGWRPKKRK